MKDLKKTNLNHKYLSKLAKILNNKISLEQRVNDFIGALEISEELLEGSITESDLIFAKEKLVERWDAIKEKDKKYFGSQGQEFKEQDTEESYKVLIVALDMAIKNASVASKLKDRISKGDKPVDLKPLLILNCHHDPAQYIFLQNILDYIFNKGYKNLLIEWSVENTVQQMIAKGEKIHKEEISTILDLVKKETVTYEELESRLANPNFFNAQQDSANIRESSEKNPEMSAVGRSWNLNDYLYCIPFYKGVLEKGKYNAYCVDNRGDEFNKSSKEDVRLYDKLITLTMNLSNIGLAFQLALKSFDGGSVLEVGAAHGAGILTIYNNLFKEFPKPFCFFPSTLSYDKKTPIYLCQIVKDNQESVVRNSNEFDELGYKEQLALIDMSKPNAFSLFIKIFTKIENNGLLSTTDDYDSTLAIYKNNQDENNLLLSALGLGNLDNLKNTNATGFSFKITYKLGGSGTWGKMSNAVRCISNDNSSSMIEKLEESINGIYENLLLWSDGLGGITDLKVSFDAILLGVPIPTNSQLLTQQLAARYLGGSAEDLELYLNRVDRGPILFSRDVLRQPPIEGDHLGRDKRIVELSDDSGSDSENDSLDLDKAEPINNFF